MMRFKFNVIEQVRIFFRFHMRRKAKQYRGGGGGSIYLVARRLIGAGKIVADGGDGSIGGRGGEIEVISEDNQFAGEYSAKGGKSLDNEQ